MSLVFWFGCPVKYSCKNEFVLYLILAQNVIEFLHIQMLNKFIDLKLENRNAGYFEILPNN